MLVRDIRCLEICCHFLPVDFSVFAGAVQNFTAQNRTGRFPVYIRTLGFEHGVARFRSVGAYSLIRYEHRCAVFDILELTG